MSNTFNGNNARIVYSRDQFEAAMRAFTVNAIRMNGVDAGSLLISMMDHIHGLEELLSMRGGEEGR